MQRLMMTVPLLGCLFLSAVCVSANSQNKKRAADVPDLADRSLETVVSGQVYRIGDSGIAGTVETDHIRVMHIAADSAADGNIMKGDKIRALQYRGVGGDPDTIRKIVEKRMYRLGRDWDWHLYVTVERPGVADGDANRFTFDLQIPRSSENPYHFGPTGFFAQIHADHLQVSHVVAGAPSEGKLQVGDKIVAVGADAIGSDIFKCFTRHIDHAERENGGGTFPLTIRRPVATGTVETVAVNLQLDVLGAYDDRMPIDCPKTDTIITRTADGIMAREEYGRLGTSLIALLATGEQTYIHHVRDVLHSADWATPDIALPIDGSKVSWHRAYRLITLCEYYLLTNDAYVLPAIRAYAGVIARGQDAAGLWNHKSANPAVNFGKLHGRLSGYGAINQTSVALWIGLILAEDCGVKDPEVKAAVEKTHRLYSYWVGRGRLPYGNHGAGEKFFTNNGTSGSAAVGFALLGDNAGASFFAKLSAAATDEILTGHTGPWFNQFWSGLGANVAGPEVLKAHSRALHWLRTVTRTWDNRFLHMEARWCKPGDYGLGTSGSMLLNLAAGRRVLRITGRGMDRSLWLDAEAAAQVVNAGMIDYAAKPVDALVALLGHALPPVRTRAAEMLAIKGGAADGTIKRLLAEGTRNQRIGAIHAIGSLKISSAVDALIAIVKDSGDDLWVRQLALRTLTTLDGSDQYAPTVLRLLAEDKRYDVQGRFDQDLGRALVTLTDSDPYTAGLDKTLLYQGVNKLLAHKRQEARGAGMKLLTHMPIEDLHAVADQMIDVIKDRDRSSYVSYHGDNHRQMGLDILYRMHIDEVLDLTVNTINEKVGRGWRARNRKAFMQTWGAEAKRVIPEIREVLGKQADPIIERIEAADTGREMISLEEALRQGNK